MSQPQTQQNFATADGSSFAGWRTVETWVFDLDHTLYPPSAALFAQIEQRMRGYIAEFLNLDLDAAWRLQKQYFYTYGMSLRGLMDFHAMDPAPFLAHVHDIDLSVLDPSPALGAALAALPGRKLIFTNASARHAERVLERLGVAEHFEAVFDIVAAEYRPKPEPETYRHLVCRHNIDPRQSVMIEDQARNLPPAAALGMTTVWLRCGADEPPAPEQAAAHVHHIVDDLVGWLTAIGADEPAPAAEG
ncbi:MAG: pyrimidine 5'-nucleotidase [Defluviicoccus sp.]